MKVTITNLSREVRALLASANPARISLSTLRTDAKASGLAQVIAHSSDPSRVIIVWPTGSVWGTSGAPMGWVDAIAYAASRGGYTERVGEVLA